MPDVYKRQWQNYGNSKWRADVLKLELELEKIIGYNKSALFPILVLGAFLVYFFSVSDFSEENYHAVHGFFVGCVGLTLLAVSYTHLAVFFISGLQLQFSTV